jgi:hypothetical protein
MRIEFLADNYHLSGIIEKWYKDEWYQYYGLGGSGDARKEIRGCCNRDKLPIVLVATDNDAIYGTVALKMKSASHTNLTPWLTALYVAPEMRGKALADNLSNILKN